MRGLKPFVPKVSELAQYTGKGGLCTSQGQTVKVKSTARKGWFVVEVVHPDGHTQAVSVKGHNLSPLQPQLF